MEELIWTEYEDFILTDYIFETNRSVREIALEFATTELDVKRRIRELGLSWVKRSRAKVSRGQASLTTAMQKLLPGQEIINEEPIGSRLRLDVYCPAFKLAAEYHGRQHFEFVQHFHGDREGFRESQERDEKKQKICDDLGIALVVFRYNDALTEDAVYERLLDAIRNAPTAEAVEKKTIKGDPYYEAWKQRRREYNKKTYQKMKGASKRY